MFIHTFTLYVVDMERVNSAIATSNLEPSKYCTFYIFCERMLIVKDLPEKQNLGAKINTYSIQVLAIIIM